MSVGTLRRGIGIYRYAVYPCGSMEIVKDTLNIGIVVKIGTVNGDFVPSVIQAEGLGNRRIRRCRDAAISLIFYMPPPGRKQQKQNRKTA